MLQEALGLPLPLAVSDLLYEREMQPGECPEGLRVEELPSATLERAFVLHRLYPRLALTDASTLALAAQRSWPLITQVPMLSRLAAELGVQLRSIDWLRDELRARHLPPQVREEKGTFTFIPAKEEKGTFTFISPGPEGMRTFAVGAVRRQ